MTKGLKDTAPAGLKRPEPTAEQTKLFRACADLLCAKAAIAGHRGPYSGPDWEAKTRGYRTAWDAFEAVCNEIKGEG